jgi:hypothetical protein
MPTARLPDCSHHQPARHGTSHRAGIHQRRLAHGRAPTVSRREHPLPPAWPSIDPVQAWTPQGANSGTRPVRQAGPRLRRRLRQPNRDVSSSRRHRLFKPPHVPKRHGFNAARSPCIPRPPARIWQRLLTNHRHQRRQALITRPPVKPSATPAARRSPGLNGRTPEDSALGIVLVRLELGAVSGCRRGS